MQTLADAIDRARVALQDTAEPYRYTKDTLLALAQSSLARLREDRPDLFLRRYTDDLGNAQPEYNLTHLDEAQRERLALSIAVRATAVDDEANADGRLATLLGIANL